MKNKKNKEKLKNKSAKGLFAILLVVVMMFSLVPLAAIATNTITTDTTDSSDVKVTTKAKAATTKITWNVNGGKIGTKNTKVNKVKKGSKIGKLLVTPKRTGYTFKGWYTKKTGGKKISKNTKVSKKVTYYARWTKGVSNSDANNRVLTDEEKKLVGTYAYGGATEGFWSTAFTWGYTAYETYTPPSLINHAYKFKSDETYQYHFVSAGDFTMIQIESGNWKISSKGTLQLTNRVSITHYTSSVSGPNKLKDDNQSYRFTTKNGKEGIEYGNFNNGPAFYLFYEKV